jgi:hypothetical protein
LVHAADQLVVPAATDILAKEDVPLQVEVAVVQAVMEITLVVIVMEKAELFHSVMVILVSVRQIFVVEVAEDQLLVILAYMAAVAEVALGFMVKAHQVALKTEHREPGNHRTEDMLVPAEEMEQLELMVAMVEQVDLMVVEEEEPTNVQTLWPNIVEELEVMEPPELYGLELLVHSHQLA